MGFGVRIMPGVRVRVSKRGIRTSVGPRIARVHVGAGLTGFSTGIGPFSYGTSIGGARSRVSRASSSGGSGPQMTIGQMEKILQADQIQTRLKELTEAHRQDFKVAERELAGLADVPTVASLARIIYQIAATGVSIFARKQRRAIRAAAQAQAKTEKLRLEKLELKKQAKAQAVLDGEWDYLLSNDPELLMPLLTEAFGDNEATCTPISIEGDILSILMLAPDSNVIPDKKVGETPTGRLSVRQLNVAERREIYFDLVFSQAVASIREAFAVAPGIQTVKFVLVRNEAHAKLGGGPLSCIGFGSVDRRELDVESLMSEPYKILANSASRFVANISKTLELQWVDLKGEPEINALLSDVNDGGN